MRGPLTREKLLAEGVECPEIYGDPALLTPLYYRPDKQKRYKYGIISHVSNQASVANLHLNGKRISEYADVRIINLGQYTHWHDIIDQVCECEAILSSSLHGLIIAEAYHVPNVWIEFGKPLIGGHFKFHDFFMSIHCDREKPVTIHGVEIPMDAINKEIIRWVQGSIDLLPLLNACPFQLRKAKYTI